MRPKKIDLESERANLRSGRADFKSEKADSWPERPNGEGTNRQTDKQTNESPPVFYRSYGIQDFVPFGAAA